MNFSIIKNFKAAIKKYIYSACINDLKVEPVLIHTLDLSKINLERKPVSDVFQKQNYSKVLSGLKNDNKKSIIATDFLQSNPITPKTYAQLTPEELLAIRAQLKPSLINKAESLVKVSNIIKKIFDKKYGENQYTFVSIGRSLSAMANCLAFMGVKTKQIPLSGCSSTESNTDDIVKTIVRNFRFKKYKKFLENTLEPQPNNKYILCDYAYSGKTLRTFKDLLNHPKVNLGSKNDIYLGINTVLKDYARYDKKNVELIDKFTTQLLKQNFDKYAEVKYLHFKDIERLDLALEPTDLKSNKMMKFCLLDILKNSESTK